MDTCRKVAFQLRKVLKPIRIGAQVEGIYVNHAHVHLIPFRTSEEFHTKPDMSKPADDAALAAMAKKLTLMRKI